MIDYKAKKKVKIPKEVSTGAAVLLTLTNQIFAYIGGTVVFSHVFHVPVYMGVGIMALFYGVLMYLFYNNF